MKKYAILGLIFLSSCSVAADKKESLSAAKKEYQLNFDDYSVSINEYEIDGCQYIGRIGGNRQANYLTHKGNCTNPIHSK